MPVTTNYVNLSGGSSGAVFAPSSQPGPYSSGYVFPNQGTPASASTTAAPSGGANLTTLGAVGMVTGGVMSAIGAYYQAESQRMQLKSQASAAEFAARIADMNARQAEDDAQYAIKAGQREAVMYAMRAGQEKEATRTVQAARGLTAGEGSAAEVLASQELVKKLDLAAIDSNALRQSQALRRQAVNERQQGLMGRVQAGNLRATRRTIQPAIGAGAQLLGTAGQAATVYGQYQTMNRRNS